MNPRHGFTLVELLVAVLVGLVVATVSAVALHTGFAAWARIAGDSLETLEEARLMVRVERDAAAALPMLGVRFEGTPSGFRTPILSGFGAVPGVAEPVLVSWSFDASTASATREESPLRAPDTTVPSREVFRPVATLRFAYAPPRATEQAASPVWQDAWSPTTPTGMPTAVRVTLREGSRALPCWVRLVPPSAPAVRPPPVEATP